MRTVALMQSTLTDCNGIDREIAELEQEIEVVTELTKRYITENAQAALSQDEYNTRTTDWCNDIIRQPPTWKACEN